MRIFSPRRSWSDPDLAAEPAAHLRTRIAPRKVDHVEVGEHFPRERKAVSVIEPGVELPGRQPERDRAIEDERRILSLKVVACAVSHLDGSVLDCAQHLEGRDEFSGRIGTDAETPFRKRLHTSGQRLGGTVDRVQPVGKAGCEAPHDTGPRLHGGRLSLRCLFGGRFRARRLLRTRRGSTKKIASFHEVVRGYAKEA